MLTITASDCLKTAACAPLKHHYDECAERVQHQEEQHGKANEDCVEECKLSLSRPRTPLNVEGMN